MGFPYTDSLTILSCLMLLTISTAQETCVMPNFEHGFCVPSEECPFANELVQKFGSYSEIPRNYLDYLLKSKCSTSNHQPIRLCCKIRNYNTEPVTQTTPPIVTSINVDSRFTADLDYDRDYKSQFNMRGFNILNQQDCGKSDTNRLVVVARGKETRLKEYPWMALLRSDSPGDEFICGGSLITEKFVLTATHCVNNAVYPVISVRLGEHNLSTNPDCKQLGIKKVCNPPVEDIDVEDIILHPKFNGSNFANDVALVKLKRNVRFQRHIKPVCLPITQSSFELNSDDFYIAGWGTTEYGRRSDVLLKAAVTRKDRSVCRKVFQRTFDLKHLCAGDIVTGRDTCRGDSGGPLIGLNIYKRSKRYIQYGIVASGGEACNLTQAFPGIYTNIITYLPWITSNIV